MIAQLLTYFSKSHKCQSYGEAKAKVSLFIFWIPSLSLQNLIANYLMSQGQTEGSFMLPLSTKTDLYILNSITVTALILPCVPYVGMDVMQYIQ